MWLLYFDFTIRGNIQKTFRDLCTMNLLGTIGNRRGYLCYQTSLALVRMLFDFTFEYSCFRLVIVMLTL